MIDLKDLLDERSANPPSLTGMRSASIARRIADRRRHRAIAVAASFVVVLATLAGYGLTVQRDSAQTPATRPTLRTIETFAEYSNGLKVLVAAQGSMRGGEVSLLWTPRDRNSQILVRCDHPDGVQVQVILVVTINGVNSGRAGCDTTAQTLTDQGWPDRGIELGKPVTVAVRVERAIGGEADQPAKPVDIPDGVMAIAVSEAVPFDDYVFPDRPAELKKLMDRASGPATPQVTIASLPDPNATVTATIKWSALVAFSLQTQTPGKMTIELNGVQVIERTFWDYLAMGHITSLGSSAESANPGSSPVNIPMPQFAPDQLVTVTIRPERMTGAWQVEAFPPTRTCQENRCMWSF
jgi:hypothetical protein